MRASCMAVKGHMWFGDGIQAVATSGGPSSIAQIPFFSRAVQRSKLLMVSAMRGRVALLERRSQARTSRSVAKDIVTIQWQSAPPR